MDPKAEALTETGRAALVGDLGQTAVDVQGAASFDDALHVVALQSRLSIGAHQAAISYIPDGDFTAAIHTHSFSEKYERYNSYDVMPTGDGIWGVVVGKTAGVRMTQDEIESHPMWRNFSDLRDDRGLEHPPMRGWLAVPILRPNGESIGVLQLSDRFDGDFSADDEELLTRIARMITPTFELQYVNTQLKNARDELEQTVEERTAELQRSNRELDEFAYVASHDLKAPMRGIDNLSKWIAEDCDDILPDKSKEHLQKLRQRVQRMERLLDDMLAFSRAGRMMGDLVIVDVRKVVRNAIDFCDPADGFVCHVADGMPTMTTFRSPLEQVFRNLIGNAIKHHDRADGRVDVSYADAGEFVEFAVADDGPGIEDEFHERIFRMFQTLRPRDEVEGSGIGLAVVKRVVESQGGAIQVESNGRGTTFKFTWPKEVETS